jgi:hypothetical protein
VRACGVFDELDGDAAGATMKNVGTGPEFDGSNVAEVEQAVLVLPAGPRPVPPGAFPCRSHVAPEGLVVVSLTYIRKCPTL